MPNGLVWEVKLRSGETFSDARSESIEFDSRMANFKVLISPKKVETARFLFWKFQYTEKEAEYQVVLSIPVDNIAFIRLKTEEKKKDEAK